MKFSKFSKKNFGSTSLAACRSAENYLLSLKISPFCVNDYAGIEDTEKRSTPPEPAHRDL